MKVPITRRPLSIIAVCTALLLALTIRQGSAQERVFGRSAEELFPDAVGTVERESAYAALRQAALPDASATYTGQTLTVAVPGQGPRGSISGPLYFWQTVFEEATGASLDIVELPFTALEAAVEAEFTSPDPTYDVIFAPAWAVPAWSSQGWIQPVTAFLTSDQFPHWNPDDIAPSVRDLLYWDGQLFGTHYDADAMILYYRADILGDPEFGAQFEAELGYPLPDPPTTWQELLTVTRFFNGKDWNRDGDGDDGISLHLKTGEQSFFHYLALSASFVVTPQTPWYWFDPADMTPLINSPGHVAALDYYRELATTGQAAQSDWTLSDTWANFLVGNAVAAFSWGDLGPLSQSPEFSAITGKLGAAPLPCSDTWAQESGALVSSAEAPNCASSLSGASWFPVMAAATGSPELAYYFMAMLANPAVHQWNVSAAWAGLEPSSTSDLIAPHGTMPLDSITQHGFNPADAQQWLSAYGSTFFARTQVQPYLRFPGTRQYDSILDTYLAEALAGQRTSQQALDLTAQAWEALTEALGRSGQLAAYNTMINPEQ